jgi:hypothetical protein
VALPLFDQPFDDMMSLGANCRPKYQIRMSKFLRSIAGGGHFADTSYLFDWLVSPFAAVITCVATDFAGVFRESDMRIDEHQCAVDGLGLAYFHAFSGLPGRTTIETVRAEHASRRQKFQHLTANTLAALRSLRRMLYVALEPDLDAMREFAAVVRARHPQHDFMVLSVMKREPPRGLVHQDDTCAIYEIADVCEKPEALQWQGNDRDWGGILDRIRLREEVVHAGRC